MGQIYEGFQDQWNQGKRFNLHGLLTVESM